MPKTKISEFSATPANNTDIDSINIAEGCAPSGINDAIRELMAQLKDWQSGTSNDPYVVGSSGSLTLNQGTANGVLYLNGSKVVTSGSALTFDGATLTSTQPSAFTPNATFVQTATVSGVAFVKVQSNSAEIDLMSGGGTYAVNYMGADEAGLVTQGADGMRFNVGGSYARWTFGGSEQMRLTSTGLGIGTSSPANKLHVQSSGDVARFTNGTNSAYFAIDSAGFTLFTGAGQTGNGLYAEATNNRLQFYTNSTSKATLDSSGNLGVGTTSPSSFGVLVAKKDQTADTAIVVSNAGTVNAATSMSFALNESGTTQGWFRRYRDGSANTEIGFSDALLFTGNVTGTKVERARIDSSGDFIVGVSGSGRAIIAKQDSDGEGWNGASTALYVGKVNGTGRSINAGGTINASGADYAEYMTKAGDFTVAKGDVVGIDAQGKLTNVFADAISFVVKSTDPSYVGGDTWGVGFDDDAEGLEVARQTVDRIAFAGQVPVNVLGASAGQYIIPVNDNGSIKGQAVSNPTFEQYQSAVGKVIAIESDGRARIIVKVA